MSHIFLWGCAFSWELGGVEDRPRHLFYGIQHLDGDREDAVRTVFR